MAHDLIEIEVEQPTKEANSLKSYFRIEEHETEWKYFCKRCGLGWRLSKDSMQTEGNYLFLRNHAFSHLNPAALKIHQRKLRTQ